LDFISKMDDDSVFIRCYERKGKIENAEVISSLTDKSQESWLSLSRPIKCLFLKYQKKDYHWSGKSKE